MTFLSLFEVALVERLKRESCCCQNASSLKVKVFLELAVVFDTVIIVPIGLVLHYDISSMSVSSGTTSPHLLLPSI